MMVLSVKFVGILLFLVSVFVLFFVSDFLYDG